MIIVPFLPVHLENIDLIDEMSFIVPYLKDKNYIKEISSSDGFTVLEDGKVIACGGVKYTLLNKASAWALMSKDSKDYMLQITRAVKEYFNDCTANRIEIHIKDGFKEAHRWAKMLGFICETPNGMKSWGANCETYYLYSRCK